MKTPKTFEEGAERLEAILAQIGDEATPLAQAVKLYAEAADLLAYCNGYLADAKLQIEQIDAKCNLAAIEDENNDADEV